MSHPIAFHFMANIWWLFSPFLLVETLTKAFIFSIMFGVLFTYALTSKIFNSVLSHQGLAFMSFFAGLFLVFYFVLQC